MASVTRAAEESSDPLVSRAEHTILKRAETALSWSDAPLSSGLTVIVRQGGGYASVLVIGPIDGDARAYAAALERVESGGEAQWSQEDDCAAAILRSSQAAYGKKTGETRVDLDRIKAEVDRLTEGEVRVAVLRASHTEGGLTESFRSRRWIWTAPAQGVSTVRATLAPTAILLIGLFLLFVPVVASASFVVGVLVARYSRAEVVARRKAFLTLVQKVPIATMAIHAPLAVFVLVSGAIYPVADLWAGSSSVFFAIPFVALGPLPLLILLPLVNVAERRLFAPTRDEPTPAPKPVLTPEEKVLQRRKLLAMIPVFILGVALLAVGGFLPGKNPWSRVLWVTGILMFHFGVHGASWLVAKFGPQIATREPAPELETIAQELAQRAGRTVKSVEIDITPSGRVSAGALIMPDGRIVVTRRTTEILAPEEMRALLAHEVAHLATRDKPFTFWRIFVVCTLFTLAFTALIARLPSGRVMIFAPLLLIGPVLMLTLPKRQRRREFEADAKAVELTGDPKALIRCLQKTTAASPSYGLATVDTATHPALARRIEAIQALA